ncbi:hypothetical protein FF38_06328, partial [Lucilia cuprina]
AVYGRTLFGRNPAPETGAMVSAVRDETLSLSKTHFELVPADDRSVWVVDRHSTNGVVLRRGVGGADAQPLRRRAGVRRPAGDDRGGVVTAVPIVVRAGAATHTGLRRRVNEDAFLAQAPLFL